MKKINLDELYDMENLLCTFHEDTYYPERTDKDTIKRFVKEMDSGSIKDTIKEGKEVLALQPFPHEWVSHVTNKLVYDQKRKKWVEDCELYKKWVKCMIEALEEEGKKQGKL